MFGFRITYLRGSVTASDVRCGNEKDEVEWPPHPDRLFCALVQAWGDLGENELGEGALRYLEELHDISPPLIRCAELLSVTVVPRHVPVNDKWDPISKKGKCESLIQGTLVGRNRQPRRIPTGSLTNDVVLMWWPDATPTREQLQELERLATAVASLGHPSSLVSVEALNELSPTNPKLVPLEDGSITLRVPHSGRLQHLREAYSSDPRRRPTNSIWATYGPPPEQREIRRGHHKELFMFRLTGGGAPLPVEAASSVIGVWRKALLSAADQPISEAISGHAEGSTPEAPKPSRRAHLALIPIADVGHEYARSHLLGVAAALPSDLTREERRACLHVLGRVEALTIAHLGEWRIERSDATKKWQDTWSRSAKVWASVTPVVFGRYPGDLWGEEAAALVRESCMIAGLPAPVEVSTAPVSWVVGAPPARRFPPLPSGPGKPKRPHAHVRLVFAEQVAGPVLVGAGRHQGYGIFRQLDAGAE